jgi:hypothetical protein
MSVILPGNWVTYANVYPRRKRVGPDEYVIERHGVECIPGYAFYKLVGYYATTEDTVAAGDLDLVIGSPDMRQDDKPRLDAPFVVPEGAYIYRSAVNVVNGIQTTNGSDIVTLTSTPQAQGVAKLGASVDGGGSGLEFDNAVSPEAFEVPTAKEIADTTIGVTLGTGGLERVDKRDQMVIIVEIDYIADAGQPTLDEIHVPYLTEAGSDKAY